MKHDGYLTTGQVAKRTGITVRTLRFYDQINLLKPSEYNQAKVRFYNKNDLMKLQKIQTLKYIGLTLDDIKQIMIEDMALEPSLIHNFKMQKNAIIRKAAQMNYVVKALTEAIAVLENDDDKVDWDMLANLIVLIDREQDWLEQYQTANRLQTRMDMYDKFSVNKSGWHQWFFDHLGNQPNVKVLEVGCGDGSLWKRNLQRIPESWKITLTDLSVGMLEEAKGNLNDHRIKFMTADIQALPFHDEEFDIVIANHMLYHVSDIPLALAEVKRVMKSDAVFYASTMSKSHLKEIEEIVTTFDGTIQVLDPIMERFCMENGDKMLSNYFSKIKQMQFVDQLVVNEVQPLVSYITSTPMNARQVLTGNKLGQFNSYLQTKLEREEHLYITKDLGFFSSKI